MEKGVTTPTGSNERGKKTKDERTRVSRKKKERRSDGVAIWDTIERNEKELKRDETWFPVLCEKATSLGERTTLRCAKKRKMVGADGLRKARSSLEWCRVFFGCSFLPVVS
jgi:hypothetical protein